jgi:hypothetical protein
MPRITYGSVQTRRWLGSRRGSALTAQLPAPVSVASPAMDVYMPRSARWRSTRRAWAEEHPNGDLVGRRVFFEEMSRDCSPAQPPVLRSLCAAVAFRPIRLRVQLRATIFPADGLEDHRHPMQSFPLPPLLRRIDLINFRVVTPPSDPDQSPRGLPNRAVHVDLAPPGRTRGGGVPFCWACVRAGHPVMMTARRL